MATAADTALALSSGLPSPRTIASGASRAPRAGFAGSHMLARTAARFADADFAVDLGHGIGSARWWQGVATLGVLVGAALSLGLRLPAVEGPVPAAPTPAALAESQPAAIAPLALGASTGFQAAPIPALVKHLSETPERPRIELSAKVGAGGLEGALRRAGVGALDLGRIQSAISGLASLRGVLPGSDMHLVLGRRETKSVPRPLESLAFRAAFDKRVEVSRREDGSLATRVIPIKVDATPIRIQGLVGASLERSARAAGVPAQVVADYMRQMGAAIDIRRQMKGNQRFDMVIAHRRAETGEREFGQLLYAGLTGGKAPIGLMRWGNGREFFDADGEGARKGGAGIPLAGASRMASGFGMRFHPVLRYARMHQGVDFAASSGTPILASAAGSVVMAGWGGGYGNVVVLDHGNGVRTRYAHMRKFVVKNGERVRQGQKIGEVGSTGLSTGPHLHFEVWKNGKPVNPGKEKFESRVKLAGGELSSFKSQLASYRALAAQ